MVILASTSKGFKELEVVINTGQFPVWVGSDVLSVVEINKYREKGIDLTVFNYSIDPGNSEDISGALETIAEHHPDQRIWSEFQPEI